MKKWILTETEVFAPDYAYNEMFDSLEDAQKRMSEMYHDLVDENVDALDEYSLDEESAHAVISDGNEVWWHIQDVEG